MQDSVFRAGSVCALGLLFSLKKRWLHVFVTYIGSFGWFLWLLVFKNLLYDLHYFAFCRVFFLIVRGTSSTELSVVINWGNFVGIWSRSTALKLVWKYKWCSGKYGSLLLENFVAKSHFVAFKLGKKMREGKSELQNKSRNEINEALVEGELLGKRLVFVINCNLSDTL